MIKIKDQFGREIPGLYRGKNGSLIVQDELSLSRYKKQKEHRELMTTKLDLLENELQDLKSILKQLLKKQASDN